MLMTLLSLSVLGSVLATILLLLKPLLRNKVSKTFAYYLWVIVLLRLCLPFGVTLAVPAGWFNGDAVLSEKQPESLEPNSVANGNQIPITDPATQISGQLPENIPGTLAPAPSIAPAAADGGFSAAHPGGFMQALEGWLRNPMVWLGIWAAGALLSAAWHVFGYIRFAIMIRRTAEDPDDQDRAVFAEFPESTRVRLVRCAFTKTPMLLGLRRPTVVVPPVAYVMNGMADNLRDILRHELTHYRRRDLLYKWFTVLATGLHWFNPLMYLVRREIDRACELSCDEAVIGSLTPAQKQHYGETLLSLSVKQTYPLGILATTMCEDKARLKERLVAIMNHKAKTWTAVLISLALLVGLLGCSAISGVGETESPVPVTSPEITPDISSASPVTDDVTFYEKYGLTVAIPHEYIDQLVVEIEPEYEMLEDTYLISVYEKRSFEECRAEHGEDYYAGYIFSIARYTQAQYEAFLVSDGSGQSFFAKDDTFYYGWFIPTDVQFYFTGSLDTESEEWKAWEKLNEKCKDIKADFIARNQLVPYSDSEFWEKEFTYDSSHLYLTYYPYYAYQDTATAEGFTWEERPDTLVLSQPAAQGDKGIWCVERWYDNNGSIYYEFPYESGEAAADYFAVLQKAADSGGGTTLCDPVKAALAFVQNRFDHKSATEDSFRRIEGEIAGNVLRLSNQVFNSMGTLQASTLDFSGNSTDRVALEVPEYLTPFSHYASSSLYSYIWLRVAEPAVKPGGVVCCRNSDDSNSLSFYQQDGLLNINVDGLEQWFKPAYPYNRSPYDVLLGYYEQFAQYKNPEPAHTYSEAEINAATDTVYSFFDSKFTGCTLNTLTYESEPSYKAAESYMQYGHGSVNGVTIDNVIVIFCSFTTDGNQTTLNPNITYDDYMFILIRDNAGAPWSVDDWGY